METAGPPPSPRWLPDVQQPPCPPQAVMITVTAASHRAHIRLRVLRQYPLKHHSQVGVIVSILQVRRLRLGGAE